MKNNKNKSACKKNTGNLIFSAILVTAFLICSYFFMGMIDKVAQPWLQSLLCIVVFVVFGLFLFYATRVGDGKQVVRFSLATLIIMDLPALYIILAAIISQLPFSDKIVSCAPVIYLASIVLGYGIPYTFLSGYEIDTPKYEETNSIEDEINDDTFTVESEGSGEIVIKDNESEEEVNTETSSNVETESEEKE